MPEQTQEEFLKDLEVKPEELSIDQSLDGTTEQVVEEKPVEVEQEEKFNRRERRLMQKLQSERESSIALAAKLEGITEAHRLSKDSTQEEFLKTVEKIYGNETPEAVAATELLKKAFSDVKVSSTQEALKLLREERAEEKNAIEKEEQTLDTMVEDIEDSYGVDLSSANSESLRKGFFTLLEKLSPKDGDGNITQYADHNAVWEQFQSIKKPEVNRARDLATRSMVRTGASPSTTVQDDAAVRFLTENGII